MYIPDKLYYVTLNKYGLMGNSLMISWL